MLDPIRRTILYDANAKYFGYPTARLMKRAGRGIAEALVKRYGPRKRIGFFCGPGNNGGDGLAAAGYLAKNSRPEVYLIASAAAIKTEETRLNWQKFKGPKFDNITASNIPNHFDIVVECLFGTGLKGKMREPYASVVKKLNKLKGKKVAIDLPAPGFKPELYISLMFSKVPGAEVVDIGYPKRLKEKIGPGEVKALNNPAENSHKGNNGRLLIIGGSRRYHGAPLLAAKMAGKVVDLVYFSSLPENNALLKKMKSGLAEFIAVPREEIGQYIKKADAVLIGPGWEAGKEEKDLTDRLLADFADKKIVLDAGALRVADKKLFGPNCLITPHRGEFKSLFGFQPTKQNARRAAEKFGCVIVLKGKNDYVCGPEQCKVNITGNAGMTKGGTGDVLAGLIASLACRNDLFLAAAAGVFLNGLAGDRLKEEASYYYNASDLIKKIPLLIKWSKDN